MPLTTDRLKVFVNPSDVIGGTTFNVKDFGATGNGTTDDRAAVLAAHVAAEAISGGATVLYPPGTYLLDSTGPIPLTPRSGTGWLRISGYGATIKIGTNMPASPRGFLNSGRTADDQTLQRVIVEGFHIDGNKPSALAAEALRGANIFGTTNATTGGRLNYADIIFRDIYSYGLPAVTTYGTGTGNFNNQTHLYMACYHTTQGESQNTIRRIKVQNVRMEDGVHGVFIGAFPASGTGCEVYYDDILIQDSFHNFKTAHTTATGSNFQVGAHAFGDRVVIERSEGWYGNDTSFEVNACQQLVYRDCVTRDCRSDGFYSRDFHTPQNAMAKRWLVDNCQAIYANIAPSASYECLGLVLGATSTDKWGEIIVRDYTYILSSAATYDGTATNRGHAIFMRASTAKVLRLENIEARETNLQVNLTGGSATYSMVSIWPQTDSDGMLLIIDGLSFYQAGTITAMANPFTWMPLAVACDTAGSTADITVDIRNVRWNQQLPTNANYVSVLMGLGANSGVTTTLRGVVRDCKVVSHVATAGSIVGLRVGATDRCTINKGQLVVERFDFTTAADATSGVTANSEIVLTGTTTAGTVSNLARVARRDCTLRSTSTLNGAAPIAVSLQGTLNTVNGSNSATSAAGATYQVGQAITGTGIPANTFIGTVSGSTLTLTTSDLTTASNATATNTGTTVTMDRYQNLDSVREEFRITGGTVTDILHSRDAVTFGSLGTTADRVLLEPGHAVKITKSAEPTMSKTLQR